MVSLFNFFKSAVLCVLWAAGIGAVAVIGDPKDLPHTSFDFIVIGGERLKPVTQQTPCPCAHCRGILGGTAGNVVANRLTENRDVSVLVVEAGVS